MVGWGTAPAQLVGPLLAQVLKLWVVLGSVPRRQGQAEHWGQVAVTPLIVSHPPGMVCWRVRWGMVGGWLGRAGASRWLAYQGALCTELQGISIHRLHRRRPEGCSLLPGAIHPMHGICVQSWIDPKKGT